MSSSHLSSQTFWLVVLCVSACCQLEISDCHGAAERTSFQKKFQDWLISCHANLDKRVHYSKMADAALQVRPLSHTAHSLICHKLAGVFQTLLIFPALRIADKYDESHEPQAHGTCMQHFYCLCEQRRNAVPGHFTACAGICQGEQRR